MSDAAFYCVADERYFLGAVGLINSLRLVGHTEPIYLLDCGLSERQRELVEPRVTVVPAPADAPPTMLKTIAPRAHPASTMVLIDTDMIATRSLAPIVDCARAGKVVAFENDTDRFCEEWSRLLELRPLTRHRYVSFGMVALGGRHATAVLGGLERLQDRVDFERTYWRRRELSDYPLLFADQDVLNAILAACVSPADLLVLDGRLAPLPPFAGVRVRDERTLACEGDGVEPYLLHHWLVKPWLEETHDGVYSRLLRRLLTGDGLAIEVPSDEVPLRFRSGVRAFAARRRIDARERLRYHVREPLAARLSDR
jgi:hypothetical protein